MAKAYWVATYRSISNPDALAAYAQKHGLANACRVMLNSNEFLFVE